MNYVKLFLCVEVVICFVAGIKVNMQGSLSLGKDVIDSLSYYLGNNFLSGRRSLIPVPIEDPITLTVRTALLCKGLPFCEGNLQNFVNEYIVILAKAVESVLTNSLPEFSFQRYEDQLKYTMEYVRHVLEDANAKVEDDDVYYWMQTIKKINAIFQEMLDVFVPNFKASSNNKATIDLNHKVVIATTFIERKYEIKLCLEYNLCVTSFECTNALNKILINFKTMPEEKVRSFVKYFYESLYDSTFYNHLGESTAHEFQIILNDMVYSNETSIKEIMLSVQKTVEARLEVIRLRKGLELAHDILVAHVILSDLDHMFSNRTDPFIIFLNRFYDWVGSDVQFTKHMRAFISNIGKEIWSHEEDLVLKLIKEVKVFLEMTVGPDK